MARTKIHKKFYNKNYIYLFVFLSSFTVMIMGTFFYFQNYTKGKIIEKQVNRVVSYTKHNAKIANSLMEEKGKKNIINEYLYNLEGNVYIIDRKGDILYTINSSDDSNIKNIYNAMDNSDKYADAVVKFKDGIKFGKGSDNAQIKFNGKQSIVCYKQVKDNNNLYVVSTMYNQDVIEQIHEFEVKVIIAILVVFVFCITAFILYYLRQKKHNNEMEELVNKDKLTGHISYSRFLLEAEEFIKNNKSKKLAVYYGDIKNFKYINDTYGYDVGDKLIIHITNVIKDILGDSGKFARISAESFAIINPYEHREDFIGEVYTALDRISDFPEFKKENYRIGIYVGVYCCEDFDNKPKISKMIDRANMAQKSIKGSNEYHLAFYSEDIRERIIAEKEIEKRMRNALLSGEFVVFYQPKYSVKTGEIYGAEALVRWNSPQRGLLLPDKFIPLFEQNGFIINLDQYVFENVCKTIRKWIDNGKKVVSISINVSRVQFYRLDFVKRYTKIKNKYNIPDGLLELEFTESIVLENIELLRKIVNNLKNNGFVCSIDDFGSGYSSLNILKNLPMDILKLDKLFFKDSENIDRDRALVASVVTMARALKMKTVSEGIETWNQVNFLKEIGCDIIQGYVYSEPVSKNRFEHLMEGKKRKETKIDIAENKFELKDVLVEDDNYASKYIASLKYSSSTVIEADYTLDKYRVVSTLDVGNYKDIKMQGDNITEVFSKLIDNYVHPDDKSRVKQKCLPMGIMSCFYQGEEKIVSDFRMLDRNLKEYIWCRATVVKVECDDDRVFRSITFLDNIDEVVNLNNYKSSTINTLGDTLYKMFGMMFELDFKTNKYNLLFYRKSKLGDQPESGDLSWLKTNYLKKIICPDDLIPLINFLNQSNIEQQFKKGKNKMMTQARIFINDDIGYATCNITLVKINTTDNSLKVFAVCQNVEEIYTNCETKKVFETYINNSICDYYDLVYIADLENDDLQVVHVSHMFSKISRNFKYTTFSEKYIEKSVFYEDKDKLKKFMKPSSVLTALKLGKTGKSVEYRIVRAQNGNDNIFNVKTTYMKIPCVLNKVLVVNKIIDNPEDNKVKLDSDPLKNLYNLETTNFIIERALKKLDSVDKRAFILLDISNLESLSDDNKWGTHTKEDILEEFDERLLELTSETEIVCRTGGYEFIIVSDKADNREQIEYRASQFCDILKENLALDFREYKVTGNVGVSIYGKNGIDYEKLYMSADDALAKARNDGPDGYAIYNK